MNLANTAKVLIRGRSMDIRNIVRHFVESCASRALIQDLKFLERLSFAISCSDIWQAWYVLNLGSDLYRGTTGEVHWYLQGRASKADLALALTHFRHPSSGVDFPKQTRTKEF